MGNHKFQCLESRVPPAETCGRDSSPIYDSLALVLSGMPLVNPCGGRRTICDLIARYWFDTLDVELLSTLPTSSLRARALQGRQGPRCCAGCVLPLVGDF